jgi:UDP-N-acetylmuramoyl-tripeptide--D-alanyl-D-alanine ligase
MTVVVTVVCLVAAAPAFLRWWRVAQREHYLPGTMRFARRWWTSSPANIGIGMAALAGAVVSPWWGWAGLAVAAAQVGPLGLAPRGRTSRLAWTARMRRLAAFSGAVFVAIAVASVVLDLPHLAAWGLLAVPGVVDLSLVILRPVERWLGAKWVRKAQRKLAAVGPRVVAITGSYGKTTTKTYTAHLASGFMRTVASPASFNNRLGLARAINEHLTPGTQLFVAEMGTYSAGEIADMCSWVRPEVGAIVSIGPVHLERFGSEERIVAAKSEILEGARLGVICVDHPLLAEVAAARGGSTIEVSTIGRGRVVVSDGQLVVDGSGVAPVPGHLFPANLAVAVGICLALDIPVDQFAGRIASLPVPEHRQTVTTGEGGFAIIDDTFNSNPAGSRRALEILGRMGGTKAVVTQGMVEMGPRQDPENEAFAAAASGMADHLVVVGRTNRKALLRGAASGSAAVTVVETREQAVAWARSNLGPGDAVLYENDLPDHYP